MMKPIRYKIWGVLIFLTVFALPSPGMATPIHDAASEGEVELVEILIANGADVDARDVNGYTPLHIAIQEGYTDVAEVLIDNGADVNARTIGDNGNDLSPLYLSIILGLSDIESLLLNNRAQR
jgi:ankyrin repeat protein